MSEMFDSRPVIPVIEIEDADKPALVAESIASLVYDS